MSKPTKPKPLTDSQIRLLKMLPADGSYRDRWDATRELYVVSYNVSGVVRRRELKRSRLVVRGLVARGLVAESGNGWALTTEGQQAVKEQQ